jgi:hypothetical protein
MKQLVVGTKLCVLPTSLACGYKENKLIMYVTTTKTMPETVSYKVLPLRNDVYSLGSTMHPVVHNHAIASAHLLSGAAWLSAKWYCKISPLRVTYRSIKTIKSTYLHYKTAGYAVPVHACTLCTVEIRWHSPEETLLRIFQNVFG